MQALAQRLAGFALRFVPKFVRAEDGAGTAMGVSTLALMLVLVALAVDVANLYRTRALMQLTADSAAHAGMVALAETGDPARAEAAARAMVERNLPEAVHGPLLAPGDIRVVFHDAETNRALALQGGLLPGERVANAVVVRLQRSGATGNTLPTLMLHALGQAGWTLAAQSVASLAPTRRCAGRQAMVAQGGITLGAGVALEPGLCLHAQGDIALAADVETGTDPAFSLPDASNCTGPCPDPETGALAEANLILTNVQAHVAGLARGLLDPAGRMAAAPSDGAGADPAARAAAGFFATHPLSGDLEPLREVGVDIDALETGSVVMLSALQFSSLRDRPAGLIYGVLCPDFGGAVTGRNGADAETTIALLGQPGLTTLRGAILVTNCSLALDARVSIEGAAVIALHDGPLRLTAEPGARMGAAPGSCDATRRGTLMTTGALTLDGSLGLADMTVIAGGDVSFLPPRAPAPPAPEGAERVLAGLSDPFAAAYADPLAGLLPYDDPDAAGAPPETAGAARATPAAASAPTTLALMPPAPPAPARNRALQQGLRLFAGGRILAEGGQLFAPCPSDPAAEGMAPPLRRIAHVLPDLEGVLAPVAGPRDPEALPGEAARALPEAPPEAPPGEARTEPGGNGT
jgi:hypothetical protein